MLKIKKTLLIFIGFFCSTILISKEQLNFQNISIQSDEVTINEKDRLLAFKNNLEIKIENYIILGTNALLNQEDEKLEIPDSFIWVTLFQIKQLMKIENFVGPHVRGIISYL